MAGGTGVARRAREGAFRVVQLALAPGAAVGYVLWVARLIVYSRRTGVSATILASFYTRWMQHQLGTRTDETVARLMAVLPNVPRAGLRLTSTPTLLAHRLTGFVPRIYRYPYEGVPPMKDQSAARTTFFDQALRGAVEAHDGPAQLVVLGAGLDTRAFGDAAASMRCFEVDGAHTQAFTREMYRRAGVDTGHVTFVAVDMGTQDWMDHLVAAGLEPAEPVFFLWEAVSFYLDRQAVESSLRAVAATAPGSVIAFDYFSTDLLTDRSLLMRYARAVVALIDEPFRSGIDTSAPARRHVEEFLASCGLDLVAQRNVGEESERRRPPAGFAVGVVPGPDGSAPMRP